METQHPLSSWNLLTLADAYSRSKETLEARREDERTFRRGFYDGVDTVLDALARGITARQITVWRDTKVFDWRFLDNDLSNRFETPGLPEAWGLIRQRILERDQYICQYCGLSGANTVDHIVPVTSLGQDADENLVTCCQSCNSRKRDHSVYAFLGYDQACKWLNRNNARIGKQNG